MKYEVFILHIVHGAGVVLIDCLTDEVQLIHFNGPICRLSAVSIFNDTDVMKLCETTL